MKKENFKKYWKHKKFNREFIGHYEIDKAGERIFVLLGYDNRLATKRVVFESWQSAKNNGWFK